MSLLNVYDTFRNFVANLGTERDKQSSGEYYLTNLSLQQWETLYRVSWMARKAVDIPAQDATRKWREWQGADAEEIRALEAEEARLRLPNKIKLALQQARLYGGAGAYFSIKNDDPSTPLDVSSMREGDLEFITVLPRTVLTAGQLDLDPASPGYGYPEYYEVRNSRTVARIHPSRIVLFVGNPMLNPELSSGAYQGWGDPVLMPAYEALRNADSTASNIASLVYEAKVDIFKVPNLTQMMSDPRSQQLLEQRFSLAAKMKSINGALLMDGEEDYDSKTFNFAGLPEINRQALQSVAGAVDIPVTRFLGQTPSGLSSTGESDLKNYYDSVASMQHLTITPAMKLLDDALLRSTFGGEKEDISYEWASLWQLSDLEKAEVSEKLANVISTLAGTRLFPDDDLIEASVAMLKEHSIMPSLEVTEQLEVEPDVDPEPQVADPLAAQEDD